MSSSVELDIQEITNIANDIAENEEFILSKQKWRSSIDRNRAYDEKDEARDKWIDEATKTKDAIEKAKQDAVNGEAKLKVLESKAAALQPSNIQPMEAAKLRFEYIGEVTDATQTMYDMILTGAEEQISAAIARASRAIDVLNEIARARTIRATSTWIVSMNRGQGPAAAFKNAMLAVIHDEFPNRVGQRMTREETAIVQARVVENAGRSSTLRSLVEKVTETSTLRAIIISLAIIIYDIVHDALEGEPVSAVTSAIAGIVGATAGVAVGIIGEAFVTNATLSVAGPAGAAILGVLGGAIAGMVVGAAVGIIFDVLVSLLMGISETFYTAQWNTYLNQPIVYRVIVKN